MSFVETYSVSGYGKMIADRVRMEAYTKALRQCVDSNTVVLDIGAGTGIFALLACQYGARLVYAIEPSESLHVAREIAAANGFGDRIVFMNDLSTRVSLPEPADVIISDLHSILPLHQIHIQTIADARERLLAPGGRLIPQQETLWVALVSRSELHGKTVEPYLHNPYGLDMKAAVHLVTNKWRKAPKLGRADLFLEPQVWATLDYTTCVNPDLDGAITWQVDRTGTANGFCVWFDSTLADGIGFSNAPGEPSLIYGQAYFPWTRPVDLAQGDTVSINLNAKLMENEYVWSWDTRIAAERESNKPEIEFRQSTFYCTPLSVTQLRKRTDTHIPNLGIEGRIHCFILERMQAGIALGEIARQVLANFPDHFSTWDQAFHEIAELSQRFSE